MKELCRHYRCNLFEIKKSLRRKQFEKVKDLQKQNFYLRLRINEYIYGINDCVTREIFRERIFNGRSWRGVAMAIGGGNTSDGVRKRYMRQFKKNI